MLILVEVRAEVRALVPREALKEAQGGPKEVTQEAAPVAAQAVVQ